MMSSLIHKARPANESDCEDSGDEEEARRHSSPNTPVKKSAKARATLVVCPLSLMSQCVVFNLEEIFLMTWIRTDGNQRSNAAVGIPLQWINSTGQAEVTSSRSSRTA